MEVALAILRRVNFHRLAPAAFALLLLVAGALPVGAQEEQPIYGTSSRLPALLQLAVALVIGGIAGAILKRKAEKESSSRADPSWSALRREIEERRAVEAELQKNQERMRAVLDTTVDAIVTADQSGAILSCNRAAERIFGYAAEEMLGQNVAMLIPTPQRERHNEYIQRYLDTGHSRIIGVGREVIAIRKDGAHVPLDLALSDAVVDGEHLFTAVMRDLRDRKQMEAGLAAASEQVRREIGQELHDALGQQLTGISLLAKTLDRQLAARKDDQQENAAAIVDLAQQAVEQVRALSHGLYPVNLRRLGLGGALQELAETLAHRLGIQCPVELDPVPSDLPEEAALHFYRIAQEAANNAIRHAHATRISIRLHVVDQHLELCVEDNGPGLPAPPSEIKGMGLSIMAYRASLASGTLEFASGADGGFSVICRRPVDISLPTETHHHAQS